MRAAAGVLGAVLLVAGCAGSGDTTAYGQVSQVAPRLCIARTAAQGACFPGAAAGQLALGDCVRLVYRAGSTPALRSVAPADARRHRPDCPG